MRYVGWIDYDTFSIAIDCFENKFRCHKFIRNQLVRGAAIECENSNQVEQFLLSLESPPLEKVSILVAKLKLEENSIIK